MNQPSASRGRSAIGSMIFSLFGGAWIAAWSIKKYGMNPSLFFTIACGSLAIFLLAVRQYQQNRSALEAEPDSPEKRRASRVFNIVNILQGLAIFISLNVLNNLGLSEWFVPTFIFIVGAHFLPLAAVFKARRHFVVAGAMISLAVLYPFVMQAGPSSPIGCLGAGVILWGAAVFPLLPDRAINGL